MRILILFLAAVLSLSAQNLAESFAGVGANYTPELNPPVSGWALYAKKITSTTYSFNVIDITSKTVKPFTVQTDTSTGVAQWIARFHKVDLFVVGNLGLSAAASNVGLAYSGGGAGVFKIKGKWCGIIPVRVMKSTLGDFKITFGLGFGNTLQ